jgi:hypothetical protein
MPVVSPFPRAASFCLARKKSGLHSHYSVQDFAQTVRNTLEPLAADEKLAFKLELPPGHGDGSSQKRAADNRPGSIGRV